MLSSFQNRPLEQIIETEILESRRYYVWQFMIGTMMERKIVALLGGGEDTPVLITIILWIVCSAGLSVWFENIGF